MLHLLHKVIQVNSLCMTYFCKTKCKHKVAIKILQNNNCHCINITTFNVAILTEYDYDNFIKNWSMFCISNNL